MEEKKVFDTNNGSKSTANGSNPTLYVQKVLREKILSYKLAPGSKFNQEELAKEFGVSRTPVVKALHKLETEGLVDNIPQRGFFVHQLSIKELLELFTLREALELMVVNSVIDKLSEKQLQMLEEIIAPYHGNWTPQLIEKYWIADQVFHNSLLEMCQNNLVSKVNDTFQVFNRTYMGGLIRKPSESLSDHKILIKALREKDVETARRTAVEHVAQSRRSLQNAIDKLNRLGVDLSKLTVKSFSEEGFTE
jgi:DNA-binding GntR family transcriptional regulator